MKMKYTIPHHHKAYMTIEDQATQPTCHGTRLHGGILSDPSPAALLLSATGEHSRVKNDNA